MSYHVEHIRFTLECDCCGHTEKRDLDATPDDAAATSGWGEVRTHLNSFFCCPACLAHLNLILNSRALAAAKEQLTKEAACEHDYQPAGLLMRCTKCQGFRR